MAGLVTRTSGLPDVRHVISAEVGKPDFRTIERRKSDKSDLR